MSKKLTLRESIGAGVLLLLLTMAAHAEPCKIAIESNDVMQYNMHEMTVPTSCSEVEISLRHSGRLAAKIMGHDWVLAREADMPGIVNAGMAAGFKQGYLPKDDKRVIAATRIVGGGETATVTFSTSLLQAGIRYAFFCTSPGHSSMMHGVFRLGAPTELTRAGSPSTVLSPLQ